MLSEKSEIGEKGSTMHGSSGVRGAPTHGEVGRGPWSFSALRNLVGG